MTCILRLSNFSCKDRLVVENTVTWSNFQSKLEKVKKKKKKKKKKYPEKTSYILSEKFHPKQISYTFLKKIILGEPT